MYCTGDKFYCSCTVYALFMEPQPLYSEKKIKNGFHGTIHTFKIYFATVLFSFQFLVFSGIQTDPKLFVLGKID